MTTACITSTTADAGVARRLAGLLAANGLVVNPDGPRAATNIATGVLIVVITDASHNADLNEVDQDISRTLRANGKVAIVRVGIAPLPDRIASRVGVAAACSPIDWRPDDAASERRVCQSISNAIRAASSASTLATLTRDSAGDATTIANAAPQRASGSPGVSPGPESAAPAPFMDDPAVRETLQGLHEAASLKPAQQPELVGRLDRFEVIRVLGQGGMGVVLLARDPDRSNALVAIKTIAPRYVGNERVQARFVKEASNMQRMSHPHILKVTECVNRSNGPYYVMPYIETGSMARLLTAHQPANPLVLLDVATQIADALRYAHDDAGVIHRDIKPENVLLDGSGKAYLSDFGLVRSLVMNETVPEGERGWVVGTARYMAPEIAEGKAGDTRADIYSFGAMLYELSSGTAPYEDQAATSGKVIDRILRGPPTPVAELNPKIAPQMALLIEGAMARELRDRYAHVKDVLEDLRRIRSGLPIRGPKGTNPIETAPAIKAAAAAARTPAWATAPGAANQTQDIAAAAAERASSSWTATVAIGSLVGLSLALGCGAFVFRGWSGGESANASGAAAGAGANVAAITPSETPAPPPRVSHDHAQAKVDDAPTRALAHAPAPAPTEQPKSQRETEQRHPTTAADPAISAAAETILNGNEDRAIESLRSLSTLRQSDAKASTGKPLLNLAAEHGRLNVIRYLVNDRKFNINHVDPFEKKTPLDCATDPEVQKVLRQDYGAKSAPKSRG